MLQLVADYPKALVAVEVGTHSPWISRLLSEAGCEVIVANARKVRAIYQNERKCDKIDAQMIAKLVRVDPSLLHPVQHASEQCQRDSLTLKLRDILLLQRVHIISTVRGVLKSLGPIVPCPSTPTFPTKAREALALELEMLNSVDPALKALEALNEQIKAYDQAITLAIKTRYPMASLLMSIAGVGPITALSFVLVVDDPTRFEDARDIGAFLGLVPRRDQSGETDKDLPISKTDNQALRRLLVQCAQYILGNFGPDSDLRRQGLKLAGKGGKAAGPKKGQANLTTFSWKGVWPTTACAPNSRASSSNSRLRRAPQWSARFRASVICKSHPASLRVKGHSNAEASAACGNLRRFTSFK